MIVFLHRVLREQVVKGVDENSARLNPRLNYHLEFTITAKYLKSSYEALTVWKTSKSPIGRIRLERSESLCILALQHQLYKRLRFSERRRREE
jgi:hypothetical protein